MLASAGLLWSFGARASSPWSSAPSASSGTYSPSQSSLQGRSGPHPGLTEPKPKLTTFHTKYLTKMVLKFMKMSQSCLRVVSGPYGGPMGPTKVGPRGNHWIIITIKQVSIFATNIFSWLSTIKSFNSYPKVTLRYWTRLIVKGTCKIMWSDKLDFWLCTYLLSSKKTTLGQQFCSALHVKCCMSLLFWVELESASLITLFFIRSNKVQRATHGHLSQMHFQA